MKELEAGYSVEVDNIDKNSWHNALMKFSEAFFYQTWSYGTIQWGERNLSHIILKKDGVIVAAAQLRIVKIPLLRAGTAYITWGPLWKLKGEDENFEYLRNILRALRQEYVNRRGFMLRIFPKEIDNESGAIRKIYEDEGFSWSRDPQNTIVVDLTPSLEEIRKNLRRGWRRSLDAAEKEQLELVEGSEDELFETGLEIVREMKRRKKFVEFKDMEDIMAVHKDLPETLKLKIILCKYENEPLAVLGWFPLGTIGLPLLGATGDKALPLKASFPLYWKMIEYFKDNGFTGCNLMGVSKERNPGGYTFKTGLAGKNSEEISYIGQFDACENSLSLVSFKAGISMREFYRNLIFKLNKLRQSKTVEEK